MNLLGHIVTFIDYEKLIKMQAQECTFALKKLNNNNSKNFNSQAKTCSYKHKKLIIPTKY